MLACLEKAHDFVRVLLENGADPNAKDCVSGTLIYILLAEYKSVNTHHSLQDGLSCLHYKATLESPDIVQLLVDKGAKVDNLADVCIGYTLEFLYF